METEMKQGPCFLSFAYFLKETTIFPVLIARGFSELVGRLGTTT